MKPTLLCSLCLLLAACSGSSSGTDGGTSNDSGTTDGGGNTVTVQVGAGGNLTYSPSTVTIHVGDTVQWSFASAGHTVTSGGGCGADGQFCSPGDTNCSAGTTSASGAAYSHTFNDAGSFSYFCTTHCSLGMTGTVTVQ
jgi:plastocyanin